MHPAGGLERLDLDRIDSKGYAFQIETTYRAIRAGRVREIPIIFVDRVVGGSKMSPPSYWRPSGRFPSEGKAALGRLTERSYHGGVLGFGHRGRDAAWRGRRRSSCLSWQPPR